MDILHMLAAGDIGGIESLCVDIARYSKDNNYFYFFWEGGKNAELISTYAAGTVIRKYRHKYFINEYKIFFDYVRQHDIECIIVHNMSPIMLVYLGMILRCRPNVKGVIYLHANAEGLFDKKWKKFFFNWALKPASGCIAISESVKSSMFGICNLKKIKVIYDGINCTKFKTEEREGADIVRLIYVGRLVSEKGLELLLHALEKIDSPFELTIVGAGPEKRNLENLAHNKGISEKIKFVGAQRSIERWLAKADIFVHPATCKEGFGISLVESMAAGVPCIAFDHGAIPEIITNNVDGYLVEEMTVHALSRRLNEVMRQWREETIVFDMVAKNAEKRAAYFDIHKYVKELSEYLEKLE